MRTETKLLAAAAIITAGLAGAGVVYAHGSPESETNKGMMGQGMMGQGMMGQGMMSMMPQMKQMMENCNKMMRQMTENHAPEEPKGSPPDKDSLQ